MTVSHFDASNVDITLDPVVEEVRERGRRITQRFNNDPRKIFEYLRQMEQEHPEKMVSQLRVVAPSDEE